MPGPGSTGARLIARTEGIVGQFVAWSPDGTRIIASDVDPLRLIAVVDAAGYDHEQTLVEAIPERDEVNPGGIQECQPDPDAALTDPNSRSVTRRRSMMLKESSGW